MSTPVSRNNKLQGLELYAPRRVREQLLAADEVAKAAGPESSEDKPALAGPKQVEDNPAREPQRQSEPKPVSAREFKSALAPEHKPALAREPKPPRERSDGLTEAQLSEVQERLIGAISDPADPAREAGPEPMPRVPSPHAPSASMMEGTSESCPPPDFSSWREKDRTKPTSTRLRRLLQAEIVPPPPFEIWRGGTFPLFVRFSLVAAFAAIVAFGVTMLSFSRSGGPWQKATASQSREATQVPQPATQLVVADQRAFANEPLSLSLNVENAAPDQSLLLNGLARGTTLSAGRAASEFSWWLPSDKIRSLALFAPKNFVGVMNTTVDLLGSDKRLLDTRGMQLEWIRREPEPAAPPALAAAKSSAAAIEPVDPALAAMLMQRGRDFLGTGDISAARVMFRRLSDAGVAAAALALADTYDPDYLAAHQVVGVQGDRATARALYQRAKDLGSAEAGQILASSLPAGPLMRTPGR